MTRILFRTGDLVRRAGTDDIGTVVDVVDEDGRVVVLVEWRGPQGAERTAEPQDRLVRAAL